MRLLEQWIHHLQNPNLARSKKNYLFIGLGTMGFHMAGHLSQDSSINLFIFNRTKKISKKWHKVFNGQDLDFAIKKKIQFDGLITCLKDDNSLKEVLIKHNYIKHLKKDSFIIDHSTTSLALVDFISTHEYVINNNITFFDAPVSGGEAGAINGSLSVMYGGPNKNLKIITKLMENYADSIVKIGPNGHGQLTKMINQLCIAGLIQGLSEGISLGKLSKVNMDKVYEAISNGAAQSWQMDNRFKTMTQGKFNFGFAVDLMIKDLKISINQAKKNNLNLDISQAVLRKYQKLSREGDGDLDTSSLIKLLK